MVKFVPVLQIQNLSKQFGSKVLFEDAEAHIGHRSRAALVGPNGAGKSTLIKMILGLEIPDEGTLTRAKNLSIGYLPQEVPKMSGRTVLGEVLRLEGRREELLGLKSDLEAALEKDPESEVLERYGRVLEELESLDEYRLESRAKGILSGMGFQTTDFDRPLTEFSGGWLMRVALSRILLMDPDLLLLDEPTNHLDLESLLWLEEFLRRHQGAILMISHDTSFLNRLVNEVFEIDQRKIWHYKGNLEAYVTQKEDRLERLRAQQANQQDKIAAMEAFVERFRAKASKARQAQSRLKQLEKMERIELPEDRKVVRFQFPPAPHSGKDIISVEDVEVRFGDKRLFRDLNWKIRKGTRTAIVGVNGAGKTTLLKLLAQQLEPSSGQVRLGHEVKLGYYSQMQAETLNLKNTILQELELTAPDWPLARLRAVAGAFLFTGDDVQKRCGVLSGGEKARVALAKLLLTPSNFLLLDEPTNHLDVESRGVLLQALEDYTGTLCLVSHDRDFVAPLVDGVLEIMPSPEGSEVVPLTSSYEDYLERKILEARGLLSQSGLESKSSGAAGGVKASKGSEEPATQANRPTASKNQRASWQRELQQIESQIEDLEGRQSEIQRQLSNPDTYAQKNEVMQLLQQQRELQTELEKKYFRWEELSSWLS
ncbi:MAG: ABC-F family ATP-binding cassette domain-containing protein [Bdellovibrionales bacterium]